MNRNPKQNMELVPLSEQRHYADYAAWLSACRDNPGASSSYPCPVSCIIVTLENCKSQKQLKLPKCPMSNITFFLSATSCATASTAAGPPSRHICRATTWSRRTESSPRGSSTAPATGSGKTVHSSHFKCSLTTSSYFDPFQLNIEMI